MHMKGMAEEASAEQQIASVRTDATTCITHIHDTLCDVIGCYGCDVNSAAATAGWVEHHRHQYK